MGRAYNKVVLRCALAALLFWLVPLPGATLERLSLEDLIMRSTSIVKGRVTGSYAALRGRVIYTHYQIQVAQRWKGPSQPAVDVLVPGGTASGMRQTYSGAPQLQSGKDYVLFLWAGKDGAVQIIGFTQGVFDLIQNSAGETLAARAATTETMLDATTGRVVRDQPFQIRLADLGSRITLTLGAAK